MITIIDAIPVIVLVLLGFACLIYIAIAVRDKSNDD